MFITSFWPNTVQLTELKVFQGAGGYVRCSFIGVCTHSWADPADLHLCKVGVQDMNLILDVLKLRGDLIDSAPRSAFVVWGAPNPLAIHVCTLSMNMVGAVNHHHRTERKPEIVRK